MIQQESRVSVADNTGARELLCIRVLGVSKRRYAGIGDTIIASVKEAQPNSGVSKGEVVRAVIVRTKHPIQREDGQTIRFDDNAAALIVEGGAPRGTRLFGPVPSELRAHGMSRLTALAPEVI